MTKQTLREEYQKIFPDLKWETTGGTLNISTWWLSKFDLLIDEAIAKVEEKKIMGNHEPWTDERYEQDATNKTCDDIINLLKEMKQ